MAVHRALTSRLAARAGIRQVAVELSCDAAADAVDMAINRTITRAVRDYISASHLIGVHRKARAAFILNGVVQAVAIAMHGHLQRIAEWGYESARDNIVNTLPAEWLAMGVLNNARLFKGSSTGSVGGAIEGAETGDFEYTSRRVRGEVLAGVNLLEADARGIITLARDAIGKLFALDLAHPLRRLFTEEPPTQEPISKDEAHHLFASILFPPPDEPTIQGWLDTMLGGQTWYSALNGAAQAAAYSPERAASQVAASFAAGKSQREIAKDVLPYVDGVRYRARRLARTYGLAVAHQSQMAAHENLGDLNVGFQLHATIDSHSRSWHAQRNGAVYFNEPKRGQKGPEQRPNPPAEPADPRERPAGTPEIAWNCRCILTPVLRPPEWAQDANKLKVFQDDEQKIIPDPATYGDWWMAASERERRIAVGSKRYDAAKAIHGERVTYAALVDPQGGGLLSVARIHAERPERREARMRKIQAIGQRNRELLAQVSAFGFIPPAEPGVMTGAARGT